MGVSFLKTNNVIKRDSELATALNYSRGVISEYLNNKKEVSELFIRKFEEYYKLDLAKLILKKETINNIVQEPAAEYVSINKQLDKAVGDIYQRLIQQESITAVLKETIINVLHHTTGKQAALISAELEQAILMVSQHALDKLKNKQK